MSYLAQTSHAGCTLPTKYTLISNSFKSRSIETQPIGDQSLIAVGIQLIGNQLLLAVGTQPIGNQSLINAHYRNTTYWRPIIASFRNTKWLATNYC